MKSWYQACIRRNSGPGAPSPIGRPSSEVIASTSLFDDATGALVAVVSFDSDDLTVFVGEKRIEANGTLDVEQQLSYSLPEGRRAASLAITVSFRDDRGNEFDQAVLVKVI